MQQWVVTSKRADFKEIGSRFGIDQVTARIIRNRDVVGEDAIEQYLHGTLTDLADAHRMKDAMQLVEILIRKMQEKKKIRIIGDYDIDGVMSSYILYRALTRCEVASNVDVFDDVVVEFDADLELAHTVNSLLNGVGAAWIAAVDKLWREIGLRDFLNLCDVGVGEQNVAIAHFALHKVLELLNVHLSCQVLA